MTTPRTPTASGLLPLATLLGTGTCLGLSTTLAKVAGNAGLPPLTLLTWAILGAALALAGFAAWRRDLQPLTRRTGEYFLVAAFVTVAASNLIFFSSVERVGVSFVALAISLTPLLTYAGALAFGLERFNRLRAAGVATALAGAGLLAAEKLALPEAPALWIGLTLAGPVLLEIGNLYRTLRWPGQVSAEALAPGMLAAAAVMLFVVAAGSGRLGVESASHLGLIALQGGVFAAQFLLLFVLQKVGGPVLLSLIGAVGAVVAVPVAILFLAEAPPAALLQGAALIAAGTALVTLGGRCAARKPATT